MTTLLRRLGLAPTERVVVLTCDELGMSHAATDAGYDALRRGLATSASLMVPCPWARYAASCYRGEDIGVHLTLNAEHEIYRWGPLTHAPSLLDGDGGFPRTLDDLWDHADLDEVRRECRSQIERAVLWGFDVTHIGSHLGALQLRPEFFDVYLDLAIEFGLPMRMAAAAAEHRVGFPFRRLAADEGVVFPDHFVYVPGHGSRRVLERVVFELAPGVTELYVRPSLDTAEARAASEDWAARIDDHALVTTDSAFSALVERSGATLIGWRRLRELMAAG